MKMRNILWGVVGCMIALTMVVTSCSRASTTTTPTKPTTPTTPVGSDTKAPTVTFTIDANGADE